MAADRSELSAVRVCNVHLVSCIAALPRAANSIIRSHVSLFGSILLAQQMITATGCLVLHWGINSVLIWPNIALKCLAYFFKYIHVHVHCILPPVCVVY